MVYFRAQTRKGAPHHWRAWSKKHPAKPSRRAGQIQTITPKRARLQNYKQSNKLQNKMKATILFIIGTAPALLCAGIYGATAAVVLLFCVQWYTTNTTKGRAARFGLGRCLIKLENLFTNL